MRWRRLATAAAVVAVSLGVLPQTDARMNALTPVAQPAVSDEAAALHARIPIADLHADSLLWGRDLTDRHDRGHLDLPRMADSGMMLQVFGVVTAASSGDNYTSNSGEVDQIGMLMVARGELSAKSDLTQRARLQAADLDGAIADGFRMIGLAHFFDNAFAGSLHGTDKHGLTPAGRALVARLDAAGIIIDLAHASPAVVDEVLALSPRPPVVSHTGIRSACDSPRNLTDAQMRRIVDASGLVGIGFWEGAVCDISPAGIAAHILAAVALLGVDHVSLGSDWDGTISTTIDAARLPQFTQALLDAGASEETITAVMSGNLVAFLEANLPEATAAAA